MVIWKKKYFDLSLRYLRYVTSFRGTYFRWLRNRSNKKASCYPIPRPMNFALLRSDLLHLQPQRPPDLFVLLSCLLKSPCHVCFCWRWSWSHGPQFTSPCLTMNGTSRQPLVAPKESHPSEGQLEVRFRSVRLATRFGLCNVSNLRPSSWKVRSVERETSVVGCVFSLVTWQTDTIVMWARGNLAQREKKTVPFR